MPIDIKKLEDDLQAILEPLVIGVDANAILIIEPNDGVVPNTSYATQKLMSLNKTGFSEVSDTDINGDTLVRSEYDITFTFSSFGPNSKAISTNLNFAITDNILTHDSLTGIGLFQFNTPVVSDIPVFENTIWEERNQFTVMFHYAYEELIQTSFIKQSTIDGVIKDNADNIVLTTSQTIIAP